ncbi:hypothetical protein GGP78_003179 [Salinibacter ruber]|nr:hypothetical protein [Salinibacter ruber]MCS3856476.1 hypothetical protein [Salinibacter ruber]
MSDALPETEHLKTDEKAYRRLARRAIDEVIQCLLVTEHPSGLTIEKVRDRGRIFAACSTEPWARATGVIRPKEGSQGVPSGVIRKEHRRLIRTLRDRLITTLQSQEKEVWKEARKQMVRRANYAVFRVTESTVHLRRIMPNKKYQCYGYPTSKR